MLLLHETGGPEGQHTAVRAVARLTCGSRCAMLALKALRALRLDCRNVLPSRILRLCLGPWFEEQDFGS